MPDPVRLINELSRSAASGGIKRATRSGFGHPQAPMEVASIVFFACPRYGRRRGLPARRSIKLQTSISPLAMKTTIGDGNSALIRSASLLLLAIGAQSLYQPWEKSRRGLGSDTTSARSSPP